MEQIKLVQMPVIQHKLVEVGKEVKRRIDELNLPNLIATEDTIQSLKTLRADLNKEAKEFEDSRKMIKTKINEPYDEFEQVYKKEIITRYTDAVNLLKDTIGKFENRIKENKQNELIAYFEETCQSMNVDFLTFKDTGIEANLSTSLKKYKEDILAFVQRVQDDILLIDSVEHPAECMIEYKANGLNASKAIKTVVDRKESERLEKERLRAAETSKRIRMLQSLAFVKSDLLNVYHHVSNDEIYIKVEDVEKLKPVEFTKAYAELSEKIKLDKEKAEATQTSPAKPETPQKPEILTAPTVETTEEIFTARFKVKGTRAVLMSLGQYMKDNGIEYTNI